MQAKLNPKIVKYLSDKLEITESTVAKNISLLKRKYPKCSSNAVAHIYAQQNKLSVLNKLSQKDKDNLPHLEFEKTKITLNTKKISSKKKEIPLLEYDTSDYFIKGHIKEINRAYNSQCYTSVYILFRKVIENLIVDILRTKFPVNVTGNIDLYYDTTLRRTKDFSVVLKNLFDKRHSFEAGKEKIIERINQRVKNLKSDANDKTHSWYHLVEDKTEIDNIKMQSILELFKKL